MKIGFIGLGQMGKPMAMNLLKSGEEVTVHSVVTDAYAEFERAGSRTASNAAELDRVERYLRCVGNNILFMGPVGSGQLTKLINQFLFDINCAALAEILPMAVKMGLDAEKVGAVIDSGTGRSYASEFFVPRILEGGFSAGCPMKHAYKDLVSAAELGARLCIPMPVLAAATATYQTALLKGHGERDKGAMILPFEELPDVRFRNAGR